MENVIINSDTYFMRATPRLTDTGVNAVGGGWIRGGRVLPKVRWLTGDRVLFQASR
jgi:hypothetical protein